jgi:hypothetical protein
MAVKNRRAPLEAKTAGYLLRFQSTFGDQDLSDTSTVMLLKIERILQLRMGDPALGKQQQS